MYNNQSAFNKVCAHLKQQGVCCMSVEESVCAYAGPEGRACAIGCLLPRDLCERLDVFTVSGWNKIKTLDEPAAIDARALLTGVDDKLLERLQTAHDDGEGDDSEEFWKYAKQRLIAVAHRFNLETPPELQS